MRSRPGPRILRPADIDQHERTIADAFASGDPQSAWEAVQRLLQDVRYFSNEAARERLRLNLGTAVCTACEGLKAGPDVVATCFQLGQCFYSNKKTADMTTLQQGLIERLTK